jgi:molybdopterin synthase sulfur carrier subunit
MVTVNYFASVRERIGIAREQVAAEVATVGELVAVLSAQGDAYRTLFDTSNLLCAVNQELVDLSAGLESGDEVAFFPPVTGG